MPSPNLLQTKTQSKTKTRLAWAIAIAAAAAFSGYILSQKADTICAAYPTFCERFSFWTSGPSENGQGTVNSNTSGINQRNDGTRTFDATQESNTFTNELAPNNGSTNTLVPNDETTNTLVPNDEITNTLAPNPEQNVGAPDPVISGGSGSDPVPPPTDPVISGGAGVDPAPGEKFPSGGSGSDPAPAPLTDEPRPAL